MKYGYVRISSKDQHLDRQILAMKAEGIAKHLIYQDIASGKNFNRIAYQKLLKKLLPGDELVIKSIDRLGRNYEEMIEQWRYLTKDRQVAITVLDFPLLNTKNHPETITGQLISDIILQVLSYVAQIEREQLRQRQKEGIAAAKKKGVRFGRPPLVLPEHFSTVLALYHQGKISIRQGAKKLGVSRTTFHNWIKRANLSDRVDI